MPQYTLEYVKDLIENKDYNINFADTMGNTLFAQCVATKQDPAVLVYLIDKGANIDIIHTYKKLGCGDLVYEQVLELICINYTDSLELIKAILTVNHDYVGWLYVRALKCKHSYRVIEHIIKLLYDTNFNESLTIECAVAFDNIYAVKVLMEQYKRCVNFDTIIKHKAINVAMYLESHISMTNSMYYSLLLHVACYKTQYIAIPYYMTKCDDYGNILHDYINKNLKLDIIKHVIQYDSKLVDMVNSDGDTPLMLSIHLDRYDLVEYLIKCKCNIDAVNNNGDTALSLACKESTNTCQIIQYLIDAAASVQKPTQLDPNVCKHLNLYCFMYLLSIGIKRPTYVKPELYRQYDKEVKEYMNSQFGWYEWVYSNNVLHI